jgi:uncharacterized tellurite resistance protein B-like protein
MLSAARDFFDRYLSPGRAGTENESAEEQLRLAVAALLVEVVRADATIEPTERQQLLRSIANVLQVEPAVGAELLALAEHEAEQAHDLFQFTSRINRHYSPEQKQRLVEQLWQVARADAIVHKYEEHLIRRVADLLHVPHSSYIAAKLASEAGA